MAELKLAFLRGAGDVGTAVGLLLRSLGYALVYAELPQPTALRRLVSFAEAVYRGEWEVQGVRARRARSPAEALDLVRAGLVAVLAPEGGARAELRPAVLVDARMAKRNLGTRLAEAPVVIGLGPGFTPGVDCHAAVETLEGPALGRVYLAGSPLPPTHRPCAVEGLSEERVLRAPCPGIFEPLREIGARVAEGEPVGRVGAEVLRAPVAGVIRGLLHPGLPVAPGMKVAEIDPRDDPTLPFRISTRSLRIAEGVVEALRLLTGAPGRHHLPEEQGV
ncbi:MAG: selenium-dependent molybdenum cofactor biosynthesis protein YqeB [Candidatus Bipolaricaulota bacterium]|nr:selenium-dependent molybdenum cofactor biosynthesis protein YqeB [Candidatus Bipolaricaulota bacterium]